MSRDVHKGDAVALAASTVSYRPLGCGFESWPILKALWSTILPCLWRSCGPFGQQVCIKVAMKEHYLTLPGNIL